jgi:4-amino-4-deoxy-L-arabinose transferase
LIDKLWLPESALLAVFFAIALIYVSYRFAKTGRSVHAALMVAAAALLLRAYAAFEFGLHPWDDRFHALVAKHLIEAPLWPTLYADPALPYDYQDWFANHVWLHKPPLALWIQAASMSVFGVSEVPLRLPSALFATASVLLTFGIGSVLFSPAVGHVAAVFHAFNGILAELAAGRRASDHVDTLLIFLIEAGIFATLVLEKRRPRLVGVERQ